MSAADCELRQAFLWAKPASEGLRATNSLTRRPDE
jgi:hypothetical protein